MVTTKCLCVIGGTAILQIAISPAFAADAADAAAAAEDQLPAVIVTAQRRAENLQNVPITVSVVDSAELDRANIKNVADVPALVPGLIVSAGTGSMTTFLRGVGNPSNIAGNEASVPMYIDGIYYAHLTPALLNLNNVDHIEVDKGPQGTLFGRNSTGGLIQVVTRTPSFDPSAELQAGYANYDTPSASAYLTGGLGNRIAADVAFDYRNQASGWGDNVFNGKDVRAERHAVVRSKVLVNITDLTKLTVTGDYVDSLNGQETIASNPFYGTTIGNPPGNPLIIYPRLNDFYDINQNRPATERSWSWGVSARLDQDVSFANFVSLTAWRRAFTHLDSDSDMTPLAASDAIQLIDNQQTSQEFQLLSKPGGPLDWVVGLYYLRSVDGYPNNWNYGTNYGGNGISFVSQQVVRSYAGYSQATYHVTPSTGITAGVRYTTDRVYGTGRTDSVQPTSAGFDPDFRILTRGVQGSASSNFNKVTWKGGIDQQLTDDMLLYASVSTGYKSGLYNLLPFSPTVLKPETNRAYELGLKTTWLDHRLRVNVAGFWNDESNVQVQQSISTGTVLAVFSTNAGKARARGLDFDAEMKVTSDLSSTLSLSWLDGRYTQFSGAPSSINNNFLVPGVGAGGAPIVVVPGCTIPAATNLDPRNGGNVGNCPVDATGNRLPRAPIITATWGLNYHMAAPFGGGFDFAGYVTYNDGYYFLADNKLRQPSYTLVNASLRYGFADGTTAVQLWGKNLGGKEYYAYVSQFAGSLGDATVPGAPRTYGITLSKKF